MASAADFEKETAITKKAYKDFFGTPTGKRVLRDLEQQFYNKYCASDLQHEVVGNAYQRDVITYIHEMIGENDE